MNKIEKDFFKIITSYDYDEVIDESNIHVADKSDIEKAQACARKYEEGLERAYYQGWRDKDNTPGLPTEGRKSIDFKKYLKKLKEQ